MLKLPLQFLTPALVALLLAIIWTYLTRDAYSYNMGFGTILDLNVFPLFAWTIALTTGYSLIRLFFTKTGLSSIARRTTFVFIFYILCVIIVETVGYHVLGIHNLGTSQYSGLPLCDCLHAPVWMQAGYFLLGPIHWAVTSIVSSFTPLRSLQNA